MPKLTPDRPSPGALAASRLPELPSAGYGNQKARALSDAIMFLLRMLERNRLLLLEVVLAGKLRWRKHFKAAYRVIGADDEFADAVFGYCVLLAGPNPEAQKARLLMAYEHRNRQRWDHRLRTALALSKDSQSLLHAIAKDEAKVKHRPVRFFLNGSKPS
jgi:hypothetical protein